MVVADIAVMDMLVGGMVVVIIARRLTLRILRRLTLGLLRRWILGLLCDHADNSKETLNCPGDHILGGSKKLCIWNQISHIPKTACQTCHHLYNHTDYYDLNTDYYCQNTDYQVLNTELKVEY